MTYSESARGVMIPATRVREELARHGFTSPDELRECLDSIPVGHTEWRGSFKLFDAGAVLDWLGY